MIKTEKVPNLTEAKIDKWELSKWVRQLQGQWEDRYREDKKAWFKIFRLVLSRLGGPGKHLWECDKHLKHIQKFSSAV